MYLDNFLEQFGINCSFNDCNLRQPLRHQIQPIIYLHVEVKVFVCRVLFSALQQSLQKTQPL